METLVVERAGNLSAREIIKYLWRVNLFLDKCTKGGTVVLRKTGEEVQIDPTGSQTKATVKALTSFRDKGTAFRGSYAVNLKDGRVVPISNLEKTEEFGGGAGVAGGSEQTRIVEAGQCIKCADLQFSEVSLRKGETVEKIRSEMESLDESWHQSIDAIGELLAHRFKPGVWHWQDDLVASISKAYSSVENKIAGRFDRYNPADIWYTSQSCHSIEELAGGQDIHDLQSLTKVLNDAYASTGAVGISLKKTPKPEIKEYTGEKRDTKFDLENITVTERAEGTLTVNITFDFNKEAQLCQIRKDGSSYRATFKAKDSIHHYDGSVGKGIILHCLSKICSPEEVEQCDPRWYIRKREKEAEEYVLNHPEQFSDEDIQEVEDLLEGIYPVSLSKDPEWFDSDKISPVDQAIADSLDKIVEFLERSQDLKKEFLGRLVRYAWSIHTDSCNFLKVC